MAASSNGEGKKALAAWDSWCSVKTIPRLVLAIELLRHLPRQVELLPQPERHRLEEGPEAGGRKGKVGFEEAFELQERLVVEADIVQVSRLETGLLQAIIDGVGRESWSCFLRVKRSSWAAATILPSTTSAAAES